MPIRLTISVNQSVIQRAKAYAKSTGRSLSEIVEQHLDHISRTDEPHKLSADFSESGLAVLNPDEA